jgi:hypothetical protein
MVDLLLACGANFYVKDHAGWDADDYNHYSKTHDYTGRFRN